MPPDPENTSTGSAVDHARPEAERVHRVAVVAGDTVAPVDLAVVVDLFGTVETPSGALRYEVGVVGPSGPDTAASPAVTTAAGRHGSPSFLVVPERPLAWALAADTVVVPGHGVYSEVVPGEVSVVVKEAWHQGARVVALGLGVFALAAAGVLDERWATTHWRWVDELARRHPRVRVRRNALFLDDGRVHTAAGAAGAVDLVLALIEHDHGVATAAATANVVVASPRREGSRAQYLDHPTPTGPDPIGETLVWAEEHLADDLGVADLAGHAHLSTRHFARRFRAAVGTTPLDWLLRVRVRRAQYLLETTTWSIDRVAHESGFGSPGTFRHHFARVVGTTPGDHRRSHAHPPVRHCA